MVDPKPLVRFGGGTQRIAAGGGPLLEQTPAEQQVAACGVKRASQLRPRVAGAAQEIVGFWQPSDRALGLESG